MCVRGKLCIVTAFCALAQAASAFANDLVSIESAVDAVASEVIEKEQIVGLSIGVAKDGKQLLAKGYGLANVEFSVPATAETVYRIGSITKEFTAVAILLLAEDGKLNLDDPLSTFLPDYPSPGNAATIRQLLQHTSGIKDFTRLPEYRQQKPLEVGPEVVLKRFANLPLDFPSGTKYRYCNSGFFLLGLVIEKASGTSYREFVQRRILDPCELASTFCDSQGKIITGRASGYSRWGRNSAKGFAGWAQANHRGGQHRLDGE